MIIFYGLILLIYFYGNNYILNILALYSLYITFQFVLFVTNEPKEKIFNISKFILISWLFGWCYPQIFEKYYLLNTNQIYQINQQIKYQQNNKYKFKAVPVHPMQTGLMF